METICVRFYKIKPDETIRAQFMSHLLDMGFSSFWEDQDDINAYIAQDLFNTETINALLTDPLYFGANYTTEILEDKNWNEEWEKNFEPVVVAERIYVRAPFHPQNMDYPHQILIEPKMSFGTAHHATTALMLEHMLNLSFKDKSVCDAGCGTGILGIFALQQGAKDVLAFDNDVWAQTNAQDNFAANGYGHITVFLSDASIVESQEFNIILVNIHKNVILADMRRYAKALNTSGSILFSGFHFDDLEDINTQAESLGLKLEKFLLRDDWVAALFTKTHSI